MANARYRMHGGSVAGSTFRQPKSMGAIPQRQSRDDVLVWQEGYKNWKREPYLR